MTFDLDKFLSICKKFNIKIEEGSGKILIEGKEVRVSDIIVDKLKEAKNKDEII